MRLFPTLRSRYRREARRAVERTAEPPGTRKPDGALVTPDDLVALPPPVRTYLERVGVVGRPRPRSFVATFRARIRGGPDEPWMEGTAEQVEAFEPPVRLFFMGVKRAGVPVQVLHRYDEGRASMEGRLLGVVPLFRHSGPELTRSETVTLLNDVFFLAPAALVELGVEWEMLDDTSVRASFSRAGHEVSAVAYFDEAGDLVNFESLDRDRMEGGAPRPDRWTTPFYAPQEFGGHRLPSGGRACWGGPGEEWAYADFVLDSIRYDPDDPGG